MAFELDDPQSSLCFTSRLAREQSWLHVYASEVVHEYKRFLALSMLAGHPVTPSEDIDQAWHLHLVYTRSYWHDLCRDLLKHELHHGPTKGGEDEGAKFHDWYSQTLLSYQRLFENAPPPKIWPAPSARFAHPGSGRWIDSSKYWVYPKPRWCAKLLRKLTP